MRISMVSEHASPLAAIGGADAGGQNVHVAALSTALARRGHAVVVYTRRDDPDIRRRVRFAPGVEVVHVDAGPAEAVPKDLLRPFMAGFAEELVDAWTADAPDLVHAHFWMSGVAAHGAATLLGAAAPPIVQTFHALGHVKRRHQGAEDTSPAERDAEEPEVGRRAAAVIATCSDEAFELVQLGVPATRLSIVPCGVDVALFSPDGAAEPRSRRARVAVVGRLVPRKGVETAISAIAQLRASGRDVELHVVGGSTPRGRADADVERLRRHAVSEDVADLVVFRGRVPHDELPRLLRAVDLVVCAPWYEPFGIVPLEAMATGVPVIASAVGGLVDTVLDGVTGIHVPPHDSHAVAEAAGELLSDGALRASFGAAGVRRARTRYTWDRIATDTERVYRRVLAGGATRRSEGLAFSERVAR